MILQHDGGIARQGGQRDRDEAAREEHRQAAPQAVVLVRPEALAADLRLVGEGAVAVDDGLRAAPSIRT
jgi:hypothetical protein